MASHLCEMLLAQGHEVVATYYKPTVDIRDLAALQLQEVDITDWCAVWDSIHAFQPEAVYHLAAQSYPTVSWARPVETMRTNVIGTVNIFEAVKRLAKKPRVIVAGSSAAYGLVAPDKVPISEDFPLQPLHPYGVSKVATEQLACQYWTGFGIEAIPVRIFNCTGPRKSGDAMSDFARRTVWLERHPAENGIRVGNLNTRRTIVDVRDLNRGMILLLDHGAPGQAYNLGGEIAYPMRELLDQVLALSSRRDITAVADPKLFRPTDEPVIWGSSAKLKAATGWQPQIPLTQTIADMLDYWRGKPSEALLT